MTRPLTPRTGLRGFVQQDGSVVIPLAPQSLGARVSAQLPETLGADDRAALLLACCWGEFTRHRPVTVQTKHEFARMVESVLNQLPHEG